MLWSWSWGLGWRAEEQWWVKGKSERQRFVGPRIVTLAFYVVVFSSGGKKHNFSHQSNEKKKDWLLQHGATSNFSQKCLSSSSFPSVDLDVLSSYPGLSTRAAAAVSWQDSILRHNRCTWGNRWLLFQCEFQDSKKTSLEVSKARAFWNRRQKTSLLVTEELLAKLAVCLREYHDANPGSV